MNRINERELEGFLIEKMRKICDETRDVNPKFNLTYIQSKGFDSKIVEGYQRRQYIFSKSNDPNSVICYYGEDTEIWIIIDGISLCWSWTVGMLYRFMDEYDEIVTEFHKLKSDLEKQECDLEKQEKINQIAKTASKHG